MGSDVEFKGIGEYVTAQQLSEAMDRQVPGEIETLLTPLVDAYYAFYMSDLTDVDSPAHNHLVVGEVDKLDVTFKNYVRFGFAVRLLEDVANGTGELGKRADAVEVASEFIRKPMFDSSASIEPDFVFPTIYSRDEATDKRVSVRTFDTSLFNNVVDRLNILVRDPQLPVGLQNHADKLLRRLKESYWMAHNGEPRCGSTIFKTIENRELFKYSEKEMLFFYMSPERRSAFLYEEGLNRLETAERIIVMNQDFIRIHLIPSDQRSVKDRGIYRYLISYFRKNVTEFNAQMFLNCCNL